MFALRNVRIDGSLVPSLFEVVSQVVDEGVECRKLHAED